MFQHPIFKIASSDYLDKGLDNFRGMNSGRRQTYKKQRDPVKGPKKEF